MLTLFTTAKPFRGHIGTIQRNALRSWTLLHPDVEVILFGDDEGSAEVARELGIRHEPDVERTKFGAMRLDSMFGKAQELARHDVLCYVNCDIILMSDFRRAVERVRAKYERFLMVGRRWDTRITGSIDFGALEWAEKTRDFALSSNHRRDQWWIDYFAFSRGLYGEVPPLAVGRRAWDNWLMWKGLDSGVPVVDASRAVVAVHQNHDYNHHPQGAKGIWEGEESKRNFGLAGGWAHIRTISDATAEIIPSGRIIKRWAGLQRAGAKLKSLSLTAWYPVLSATYKVRRAVGFNRKGIAQLMARFGK